MSQKYSEQEKAEKFKQMLEPYAVMMEDWAKNLVGPGLVPQEARWPLNRYLNWFKENFEAKTGTPGELRPSREFSVAAAKLGSASSAAAFDRHFPQTLEDYFTLAHQNLLAVIGHMNAKASGLDALSQGELKPLTDMMESIEKLAVGRTLEFKPVRIGSKITEDSVSIQYRVPLQNHAAAIELLHHRDSGKTEFKVFFLGDARERWGQVRFLADTLAASGQVKMVGAPHANAQGLEYSFEATPQSIALLLEEFKFSTDVTFGKPITEVAEYAIQHGRSSAVFVDTAFNLLRQSDASSKAMAFGLLESSLSRGELDESQIQRISNVAITELQNLDQESSNRLAQKILVSIARKKGDFSSLLELTKQLSIVGAAALLADLVREGHGIDEAAESIKDTPIETKEFYDLFDALSRNALGQPKLINVALGMVEDSDTDYQQRGLWLMRELSRNIGISIDGAFEIAEKLALESDDGKVQIAALGVLQLEESKSPRFNRAKDTVLTLAESSENPDVKGAILNFFFSQPDISDREEGLKIAFRFARDVNPIVQEVALHHISRGGLNEFQIKQTIDLVLELADEPHETILNELVILIREVLSRSEHESQRIISIAQKLALDSKVAELNQLALLGILARKRKLTDSMVKSIERKVMDSGRSSWDRQQLLEILLDSDVASAEMLDEAVRLVSSAPANSHGLLTRLIRRPEVPQRVIELALLIALDPTISSYERSLLLGELVSRFPEDPKILGTVTQYASDASINGYDRAVFLKQLLNKDSVSPGVIQLIEKCLLVGNITALNKKDILKELIKRVHTQQAISMVMELALDKDNYYYGTSIFEELIDQGSIAPEVLTAALQLASNPKANVHSRSSLLKKLIGKGYAGQAIPLVMELALDKDNYYYGTSIFEELIDQGNLSPELTSGIIEVASSSNFFVRSKGIELVGRLLRNDKMPPENILSIAKLIGLSQNDEFQRSGVASEIMARIEKMTPESVSSSLFQDVIKLASDPNIRVQGFGLELLLKVINPERMTQEVIDAVERGLDAHDGEIQLKTMKLLSKLVGEGKAHSQAVQIVRAWVRVPLLDYQQLCLQLLLKLVEHGHEIKQAQELAQELHTSEYPEIVTGTQQLLDKIAAL